MPRRPPPARLEPQRRARRIMRGQHSRRERCVVGARRRRRRADGRARARSLRAARRRAAAAPVRRGRRRSWNSTPTAVAPPSIMRSTRPPRSASTCSAVVGETWPERLAEGATTGRPKPPRIFRATSCAGTRTRDGVEAGGCQVGDRAIVGLRQHQRQRPRPKPFSKPRAHPRRTAPAPALPRYR